MKVNLSSKPDIMPSLALKLSRLHLLLLLLFSYVWLFVILWTAARQASLSFTISQSLLKLMSIESVMPSNHLIICHLLLLLPSIFPSIRVFSSELVFISGGQSIGASASTSALPMNIQGWFPLGLASFGVYLKISSFCLRPWFVFEYLFGTFVLLDIRLLNW